MPTAPLLAGCNLAASLSQLIHQAPMPPIGAGRADAATRQAVKAWLAIDDSLNETCQAGLWLLAADLEQSHALSQAIATPEGSYWHGIMHRREGDYENATYWFRRVGKHPVLTSLAEEIAAMQSHAEHALSWSALQDPQRVACTLVDCCRDVSGNPSGPQAGVIQRMAWIEWQLLFRHCLPTQA